jgi:thiosulfate reductase cytochrome b subunit
MTPGQQRKAQRTAHLAAAVVLVAYLYAPLEAQLRDTVRFIVIPLLLVTGIAMWQAARIRRLRRNFRTRALDVPRSVSSAEPGAET